MEGITLIYTPIKNVQNTKFIKRKRYDNIRDLQLTYEFAMDKIGL